MAVFAGHKSIVKRSYRQPGRKMWMRGKVVSVARVSLFVSPPSSPPQQKPMIEGVRKTVAGTRREKKSFSGRRPSMPEPLTFFDVCYRQLAGHHHHFVSVRSSNP